MLIPREWMGTLGLGGKKPQWKPFCLLLLWGSVLVLGARWGLLWEGQIQPHRPFERKHLGSDLK